MSTQTNWFTDLFLYLDYYKRALKEAVCAVPKYITFQRSQYFLNHPPPYEMLYFELELFLEQ